MSNKGISADRIRIQYTGGNGFIVSDSYSSTQAISTNGVHEGIMIDGKVYDNIHPNGMTYQQWLDDIFGTGTRSITKTPIK